MADGTGTREAVEPMRPSTPSTATPPETSIGPAVDTASSADATGDVVQVVVGDLAGLDEVTHELRSSSMAWGFLKSVVRK